MPVFEDAYQLATITAITVLKWMAVDTLMKAQELVTEDIENGQEGYE